MHRRVRNGPDPDRYCASSGRGLRRLRGNGTVFLSAVTSHPGGSIGPYAPTSGCCCASLPILTAGRCFGRGDLLDAADGRLLVSFAGGDDARRATRHLGDNLKLSSTPPNGTRTSAYTPHRAGISGRRVRGRHGTGG